MESLQVFEQNEHYREIETRNFDRNLPKKPKHEKSWKFSAKLLEPEMMKRQKENQKKGFKQTRS